MALPQELNTFGYQQARIARLEYALVLVGLTSLVAVGLLAWQWVSGPPIHYIPPGGPGLSRAGMLPDAVALHYASQWLRARYTFTPATIKTAHNAVLATLHPQLTVAFQAQAEREALLVKDHALATQVAVLNSRVIQRANDEMLVALEARRTVWVGGQQVREEPMDATLTLVPWYSHGDPAGVAVSRATITPALTLTGQ